MAAVDLTAETATDQEVAEMIDATTGTEVATEATIVGMTTNTRRKKYYKKTFFFLPFVNKNHHLTTKELFLLEMGRREIEASLSEAMFKTSLSFLKSRSFSLKMTTCLRLAILCDHI